MAERREEEEREKGRDCGGSGGLYRPQSSWVRKGVTGGGRFGLGESTASGRRRQRRGAWLGASWRLGSGLGRVWAWEGAKGQARWR